LLNWRSLFKTVTIKGVSKIRDEDAYIVVKTPEKGMPVTDYVSTKSFLLLRRETPNGVAESYGDYRIVERTLKPFRIEMIVPGLGRVVYSVKDLNFNVAIPQTVFRNSEKN
jgi:outer membrane lipoprotein-sorting protein